MSYMDDPITSETTEGFGLMFFNARWLDPAIGRFTQADTIIPPGVQGLDRYAYANNSPLVYIDPTGHFTEAAIKKYLKGYCNGHSDCITDMLADWKADKDWWDMISAAQAGDTLFGTGSCCQRDGGIPSAFTLTFAGKGNDTLSGFSNTSTSLEDVQSGFGAMGSPASNLGQSYKWLGFFRTDEKGKPSFWVRPGIDMKQKTTREGTRTAIGIFAGFGIGIPIAVLTQGWSLKAQLLFAGVGGSVSGTLGANLIVDAADMESNDVQVYIVPVYFNFQKSFPGEEWTLEHFK
jgi:RHS repeat-associated protein